VTTILLLVVAYFVPTVVAANRRHARQGAILLLNALAGWTVVGWVAALCWALAGACRPKAARRPLRDLAVAAVLVVGMAAGAVVVRAGSVGEAVEMVGGWLR
jgi:hypothetical protein